MYCSTLVSTFNESLVGSQSRHGTESVLIDFELPEPQPSGRDILVAVKAISLNPVDTKVRRKTHPDAGEVNVLLLKHKSFSLHWELMFTRALFDTPDILAQHRLLCEVADLVDAGLIRTTANLNLGPINANNLKRAHALIESGTTRGKIVLEGFD